MTITMKLYTISLAFFIFVFSMPRIHTAQAAGFTIDLIHRDSLQSPSLDSYSDVDERVANALQRSFDRVKALTQDLTLQSPSAEIIPNRGEYLMKFSLGTPKVETLAIADTGSDLTWIQCHPCMSCFKQKSPIFDPRHSSTYKSVPCNSERCNNLRTSCDVPKNTCTYTMMYGDQSWSQGDLAIETITLGSTGGGDVPISNVTIGCGHSDKGTFGAGTSGIVGLGGGKWSLISQMGSSIRGQFSYCLVPFFSRSPRPSKMSFGENAAVSGDGVVSTPMVARIPNTFYYVKLEGITVGNQRLDLVLSENDDDDGEVDDVKLPQDENMIIDSGTTLTFLPSDLYNQVVKAVRSQVNLREISDPQGLLKLCYLSIGNEILKMPEVTVHFKGADVKLNSINTFVKTSRESLCLAFAPANTFGIYGNLAQMNFLVGYDLEKRTVSFKPTDCSKA